MCAPSAPRCLDVSSGSELGCQNGNYGDCDPIGPWSIISVSTDSDTNAAPGGAIQEIPCCKKARRSAFILSGCVVHMPCGSPG